MKQTPQEAAEAYIKHQDPAEILSLEEGSIVTDAFIAGAEWAKEYLQKQNATEHGYRRIMTYEERIELVANTLTVNTNIDDSTLNDEQLYEVYQSGIAMQREAFQEAYWLLRPKDADEMMWEANLNHELKQNGYIPEKEEE
jgi:hypothetical protein